MARSEYQQRIEELALSYAAARGRPTSLEGFANLRSTRESLGAALRARETARVDQIVDALDALDALSGPQISYEEYCERERHRDAARERVRTALRAGRLQKPTACQACGQARILTAHHTDYAKPLDVVFLCRSCHSAVHELVPEHAGGGHYSRFKRERLERAKKNRRRRRG